MLQRTLLSILFALLCVVAAYGQAVNTTILGTVTDTSGAAVPNARVTIAEVNTGITRNANTNESGNYIFPNLPPGNYTVTVDLTGFKRAARQDRLANDLQIEGVENQQRTGLLSAYIPPIEALQTVDVTTSNYDAELGHAGGAATNVILKSGTNQFHGSLYEFNNVSALAARSF